MADAKQQEANPEEPELTDEDIEKFFDPSTPKGNPIANKKTRYKLHRGENRQVSQQYGRDVASVIKMRYVQGLKFEEITKLTGLSQGIINQMMEPFKVMMGDPDRIRAFKTHEETLIDGAKMLLLQGICEQMSDPVRRKKVDLSRLTYGFGILFDKNQLKRGEPTSNVMTLSELVRAAHAHPVNPPKEIDAQRIEDAEVKD